jgi:hypothetical protein
MIEYVVIFIIAFIIGYSLAITQHISSVPDKELKDEDTIAGLRKEIEYYKKLCLWHVEEKAKLQRIKEQFESECG